MSDLERARLAALEEKYRGLEGDMPPFGDVIFLLRMVAAARREGAAEMRERAAQCLLNGSFLHDEAPVARLAREAAAAIRALPLTPEEPT